MKRPAHTPARFVEDFVRLALPFLLLLIGVAPLLAQEPEPFRGEDVIDGRDFEYNKEYFLHAFSYRFRPPWELLWQQKPYGARGYAGSIRSDEFIFFDEIRIRHDFDSPLFFLFRHKYEEDFDSRSSRQLVGFGTNLPRGWSLAVLGELEGDKENIDAQLELAWQNEEGDRLRLAAVAADATFNGKSDTREYERKPYTWFAEARHRVPYGWILSGWLNYSPSLRLAAPDLGFDYTYDDLSGSLRADTHWDSPWRVTVAARAQTGIRTNRTPAPGSADERRLSRYVWQGDIEIGYAFTPAVEGWIASRYFRFTEIDRRPFDPSLQGKITRREWMQEIGANVKLTERFSFSPNLALDLIGNREDYPFNAGLDDSDHGLLAKLSLPVDVRLSRDALMKINPTFFLHEARFGGGQVQLHIPF